MRKYLRVLILALFVLSAVSLQAQTVYKWRIDSITPNADKLTYTFIYSITADGTAFTVQPTVTTLAATPPNDDIKSAAVRFADNDVNKRNRDEVQKALQQSTDVSILVGKQDDVKTAVIALQPKPTPPTQAQLDQQAFSALLTVYRNTQVAESLGFPVVTKSADILTQLQATFKPEYLPFLGGRGF